MSQIPSTRESNPYLVRCSQLSRNEEPFQTSQCKVLQLPSIRRTAAARDRHQVCSRDIRTCHFADQSNNSSHQNGRPLGDQTQQCQNPQALGFQQTQPTNCKQSPHPTLRVHLGYSVPRPSACCWMQEFVKVRFQSFRLQGLNNRAAPQARHTPSFLRLGIHHMLPSRLSQL